MSDTSATIGGAAREAVAEFSLERLGRLIGNRFLHDIVPLGIGAAVILGLNLLVLFFAPHQAFFNHTGGVLWNFAVVGACALAAGNAFHEMQSGKSGTEWLLLPATMLEKYLAAIIGLVLAIPAAAMLAATGLSALLAGIQGLAGGSGGEIWTPFSWNQPAFWGNFLVCNLILVTGSAVFRKQALIKTIGVTTAFSLVVAALVCGIAYLILRLDQVDGSMSFLGTNGEGEFSTFRIEGRDVPQWIGHVLAWFWGLWWFAATPVAALAFGYFRLREKEAKDAVQ
jgi:hypothetical protein